MPLSQRCNQSVQWESSLAAPTRKSNSLDHTYEASTMHRLTTQTHCTFLGVLFTVLSLAGPHQRIDCLAPIGNI